MAIEYITPLWECEQNCLKDGNLHIDNNLIENSIRTVAHGRKNDLFAGSQPGCRTFSDVLQLFCLWQTQ
jgi:transposase